MPIATAHRPTGTTHRSPHRSRRPHRAVLGAALVIAALVGVSACGPGDAGDGTNDGAMDGEGMNNEGMNNEGMDDGADPGAGGTEPGLDQGDSDGEQRFVAISVESRRIVEGSQIEITLGDGQINAYAGCNRIFGTYRLDGDTLIAGPLASTRMACPADLMDQDTWLIRFLESEPELTLDGDEMTLVGSDGTLVLSSESTSSDPPSGDGEPDGDDHTDPAD
jgi:heat shock protein HslJ